VAGGIWPDRGEFGGNGSVRPKRVVFAPKG
jgi:hypothetical protein